MNNETLQLAVSVCYEFCDSVLVDEENLSILIYVKKKYYGPITSRLIKLEFLEVFKQNRKNTTVSLLQLMTEDNEDIEINFDEDDDEVD